MERICHKEFNTQELVTRFPARLDNRNKKIVYGISSPSGAIHTGTISFSRWRQMQLPDTVTRDGARRRLRLKIVGISNLEMQRNSGKPFEAQSVALRHTLQPTYVCRDTGWTFRGFAND